MDKLEVFKTLDTFKEEGQLIEIRAISSIKSKDNWSGYFKDKEVLWNAIQQFDSNCNIYFVLNVINDMCYSMLQHDKMLFRAESTRDKDIIARNWVLIDIDTNREGKNISSTKEEFEKSKEKAREVFKYLRDMGFSYPVVCNSGNGIHLDYKIDSWANTDENTQLITNFLNALSVLFSDKDIHIDTVVSNAARIDKLYGTYARKGTSTQERPHRLSRIIWRPDELKTTPKEYFIKVANILPKEEVKKDYRSIQTYSHFDIDEFIKKYNIGVAKDVVTNGVRKIVLEECPFNPEHKAPDSALFVRENGAIGFFCFHQSCSQYTFRDFRLKFDPNAYDKKDYKEFQYKQRQYQPIIKQPFVVKEENKEDGKKWLSMTDIKRVDITEMMSIPTGYTELDRKIVGLFAGELTVLSGLNASGKTSWLDCVALNAVQRGYKVAIWSGEMQDWRFLSWIDQIAAGKNYVVKKEGYDNLYYAPKKYCEKINKWLGDKLYLYNNEYGSKWEQLFSDIKDIVEEKGINLVILDNLAALNINGLDGDKYAKQTNFIIDLKDYAKAKNIHVILVCHPRKQDGFLRKESISGTADLTNIADGVGIIHRVGRDFEVRAGEFFGQDVVSRYLDYSAVMEVCKNRDFGITDYLVGMYFEPESRRLKNDIAEHIVYGWEEQDSNAYTNASFEDTIGDMPDFL